MKKLTGPIRGLHFKRHNSVVIDTTHGLIHFPHLTMQAKNAAIETSAKPQPVLIQDNTTLPRMMTKTIKAFVDHPSPIGMAYNRYCDTSGKAYSSSEPANVLLNFNIN